MAQRASTEMGHSLAMGPISTALETNIRNKMILGLLTGLLIYHKTVNTYNLINLFQFHVM
jgi:hypothetical protein